MEVLHGQQPPWLTGATIDFRKAPGRDLLGRWQEHHEWWEERYAHGTDAYNKSTLSAIGPRLAARDRKGRTFEGVNFASQDYLSLATHEAVREAAIGAVRRYGVHSAGSAALMGNTYESTELECELADFVKMKDCTLFTTGWSAAYGIVKTLVNPCDHIVIDILAHASLMEGAKAATSNVHVFKHCSTQAAESRLRRIRAQDPNCGILLVTETLFSMDSDSPDIAALQALADQYDATLLVDAAHDLGAIGPGGTGILGQQGMLGKIDVLMGSFSKTFASNGGFVACNTPGLKLGLRIFCGSLTFTNAMSPVNACSVRESLSIVRSEEGDALRARMLGNAILLRTVLQENGFEVLGEPSAIVPVKMGGAAVCRTATKHAMEMGAIVNMVEYPAVSRNNSRWRLQVMANHTESHIREMVDIACRARAAAEMELAQLGDVREIITLEEGEDTNSLIALAAQAAQAAIARELQVSLPDAVAAK